MFEAILLFFLFLSAALLCFVVFSSAFSLLQTRVPFVSTADDDIKYLVEKNSIKPGDIFYDLGSGYGKVVFLVEKLSGAETVGFELNYAMYMLARLKKIFNRSRAVFFNRNFFEADWSEASIIYCYLFPPLMPQIEKKILENCKPNTTVICRDFPLPNLKPHHIGSPNKHKLFFYRL
ncbi:MAG: hypothetical protein Q8R08_02595 [bacterium]|nr:hypothetical protein [bacterium]